ncbi:peroxiredoxin (plasmid) [Rhizobium leguminosarum bv. trifolii CB782]|uniref:thioredoxin-dependent peroxiredoxin n=1 Tax=Rhizobium hidalgonense TaxID=1538159 RepID=A0A2A6K748_9HYPH|nr:peroxiredoxin-like family protein [Rhizobium hidalgonense]AHG49737.1 peroxiredoxin [Rhizobium leguminosarum bv. trifolii CB782]MDR9773052.1 peroxiredoxin-like family protein [Rhizobium hidalgonense]MDR9813499.1 peroxiredoxin-like family protein [Rhizobium hidalgonense]MDR9821934.1 peroxiredoxin-like family protein [Rhizobium hidalgonense]PDT20726.1 peroxiredoxin [Rhizobium hidalgonense]
MGDQKRPLQPGEAAPGFALATANFDGTVSFADLSGRPFLIGFYRGLHCPFCRRQLEQLASVEPSLRAAGVEIVAVINTPVERARLYIRHRPTPITLLCDPDCRTHRAYGVPHAEFLPEGSHEQPEWPYRVTMAQFQAARINPTGELPEPLHPMEANTILNANDRFELTEADHAIFANHGTQLVGHFLVNANGTIGWARIEALDGPNSLSVFPTTAEIIAAAGSLGP